MRQTLVRILAFAFLAAASPLAAVVPAVYHPTGTEYITLPYFDWEDVVGAPYAGSYQIQINGTNPVTPPIVATVPAVISFYSPNQALMTGVYTWKVRYISAAGTAHNWSTQQAFTIASPSPSDIVTIPANATWADIKAAVDSAAPNSEIRLTPGATYNLHQTYDSSKPNEWSDYLFYLNLHGQVTIDGQGAKLLIHATRPTCGVFFAVKSQHIQLKNLTIDYANDSLSQYGGKITKLERDGTELIFTVEVDPTIYSNRAEFANDTREGFFVDAEHHQRIGSSGVKYTMNETWFQARFVENGKTKYEFKTSQNIDRYVGELKVGDYFISTQRGGDVIYIDNEVEDFVANNLTVNGSRGRYFVVHWNDSPEVIPHTRSRFIRSINNDFLRKEGRILGSPSGGVNDKGSESWHENVTIESTRDDAFHTGVPVGEQNVLLNSRITSAFRHSAWIQADRSWVENNTISYPGTEGITLGGGVDDEDDDDENEGTDTQISGGLIKNNVIISPRRAGLVSAPPLLPGHDNTGLTITGNTVRDHQSHEGVRLEYLANSVVSGNKVESTGVLIYPVIAPFYGEWRLYAEEPHYGIFIADSHDLSGTANQVTDSRISSTNRIFVDSASTSNVNVGVVNP